MTAGQGLTAAHTGRVLVVDDDEQVRRSVCMLYQRAGWEAMEAADGAQALPMLFEHRPEIVVLDLGMAGLDGWETLSRIRELTDVPVLMLTASATELSKVRALRGGADDYVTKPFSRNELLARSEVLLRRRSQPRDPEGCIELYRDSRVTVNFTSRTVTVDDEEVPLTPLEFRLLAAFVGHPDHVLGPAQLLSLAWQSNVGTRDQVKIYVGYLRRKLGSAGSLIETVRGFGYRYRPPSDSQTA